MEIRRFGVGHRRPEGPPGTVGLTGQVIHTDGRGVVAELAFRRGGHIEPHSNPNTAWFIVIEGGGFVQVGPERARVAAGEAVLWPPNVAHSAWTELSEMRAMVVEFSGADDAAARAVLEGRAAAVPAIGDGTGRAAPVDPAAGTLRRLGDEDEPYDRTTGEPY